MSFKPNTTVYLCAGTGMDMNNSIWWHRFAYPWQTNKGDDSWWNTCFQFFKAHSISNGFWYCSIVDAAKGYVTVGRNPLNNGSIPQGQSGLGSSGKQTQMDNPDIPFKECINAVDYLIFANDGLEGSGFNADIQYAFVTKIEYVNWNVARVYFTIDAIMTYQKFFYLGKSSVSQDMQFQERKDSADGVPNTTNLNFEPPQFEPDTANFVFQKLADSEVNDYLSLGAYTQCMVTSDVSLSAEDIQPNEAWGGIPSFKPSKFSYQDDSNMGIGVYLVGVRDNEAFKALGSYNAMEHILDTYLVPQKICQIKAQVYEPYFIEHLEEFVTEGYKGDKTLIVKVPKTVSNTPVIGGGTTAYTPLNLKLYSAPYMYYSIGDRQGGSAEIQPQLLSEFAGAEPDNDHYFNVALSVRASIAPNCLSALMVQNYDGYHYSIDSPMLTNWQMPSYSMTPNNSGWNSDLITAQYSINASKQIGAGMGGATGVALSSIVQVTAGTIGAIAGTLFLGPVGTGAGAIAGSAIGAAIGQAVGAMVNPYRQVAEAQLGQSTSLQNEAIIARSKAESKVNFGLPAAVGGLPQGYTAITMEVAKYVFYVCHLRTELLKDYDLFMSVFGYPQNKFRYPHINIRKRWCYVKLNTVNIVPIQANEYNRGGIPTEMREQIVQRLQSGVQFWNVRHALMGDGDSGASTVQSYTDGAIQSNINCKFIRNYGDTPDCDIMKENISYTGGYANDYTDDYEYEE